MTNVMPFSWTHTYNKPRFLQIPELGRGGNWKLEQIIDHPMYKGGPYLVWVSSSRSREFSPRKTTMVNRQLFYMEMRARMEMETDG